MKKALLKILTKDIGDKCLKIKLTGYIFRIFFILLKQNDLYFRGKLYFSFNMHHCKSWSSLRFVNKSGKKLCIVHDCINTMLLTFQSTDDSDISVIAQNKKCFDNDIVCSKSVLISVGDTEIYLNDSPYKEVSEKFLLGSF